MFRFAGEGRAPGLSPPAEHPLVVTFRAAADLTSMRMRAAIVLGVTSVLGACGSGESGDDSDGGIANIEPPAECALTGPPPGWTYPSGPYGQEVGDVFENLTLDDCDGNPVTFGDILSESELVLFNIGAGWCAPCIEESEKLDANVFRAYCGRGLRVIQVLFEDDQSRPATKFFCNEWRSRYTLSFPVVVDPLFKTEKYFSSVQSQTPVNFLIDSSGTIVFKETGTPAAELPQRIDQLLP